jgi:hypothetical protein
MSVSQKSKLVAPKFVVPASWAAAESRAVPVQMLGSGALTRVLARSLAWRLDRALIAGADPAGSRLLAARAALLTSARMRESLADSLDNLVCAAQGQPRRWSALGRRAAVQANVSELDALATLLVSGTPLYARGLALLNELLTDGVGPAYRGDATTLSRALSDARIALTV